MADDPGAPGSPVRRWPTSGVVVALGTVVTALTLTWLIIDVLLAGFFPLRWGGGADIGRGLIIVACYALVVAGVVTVSLGGGFRLRTWNPWSWAAAALVVALFVAFVVVRIVGPRDEEAGIVGSLGVTVSETGDPVLVFAVCRGTIDRVQISGPNRGSVPNEVLARYQSDPAVGQGSRLDLEVPTSPWTTDRALAREALAAQTLVIAIARSDKAVLRQVSFDDSDVASLEPGQVLQGSGQFARRSPLADFLAGACAGGS